MSLFNNPNEKLKKAVEWFSSLKSEQQALLIANLSNPDSTFTSEQTDNLTEITLEIAAALSSYVSKQQIIMKLTELGINEVFATLLTETVSTKPTVVRLDVKRLLLLDEDTYKRAIETIIVKFYVENNPFKFLLEYSGLSQEELIAILRFIRDFVLFSYIRGEISAQNLKKYLIEQFKFPEERADILLRYLNDNRLTIANNFLFRNTQDTNARVQRLEQNQIET